MDSIFWNHVAIGLGPSGAVLLHSDVQWPSSLLYATLLELVRYKPEMFSAAQVASLSRSSMPAADWSAAVRPPVQVADQLQSLSLEGVAPRSDVRVSERAPPDEHSNGRNDAVLARWPEFAGAFLLYFVCIPPTPQVTCAQICKTTSLNAICACE